MRRMWIESWFIRKIPKLPCKYGFIVFNETKLAYCCRFDLMDKSKKVVWIPKSVCYYKMEKNNYYEGIF